MLYSTGMELTLAGHPSFHTEGSVTIELPDYMTLLPDVELEEVKTAINREGLIVAAGRHPDGDIVFLTGAGELKELAWSEMSNHDQVPRFGRVLPIDYGQTLRFEASHHRALEVSNHWVLDRAQLLIFLGAMAEPGGSRVSYV